MYEMLDLHTLMQKTSANTKSETSVMQEEQAQESNYKKLKNV